MRVIIFIFIFLSLGIYSWSQSFTTKNKKAIKLYTQARTLMGARSFNKAFDKLIQVIKKDSNFAEAYFKLATIYQIRFQDSLQMNCYKEITIRYPKAARFSIAWYYLGKYNFEAGKYKLALSYLNTYNKNLLGKGKYSPKANLMIENSKFSITYKGNNFQFNPRPLPSIINQFAQQYFPILSTNQKTLFFVKREADEKIMMSTLNSLGTWTRPVSISANINSDFNEGTCSISADGRMLVFTSCMGRKGFGSCDLYISIKKGKEWSVPKNMGSNINSSAWDSQPSLSADGRILYFVSTRKGGFGKKDIYQSTIQQNNKWSKPKNIGGTINTSLDDISPFIHPNGQRLYFSTNGRVGFGGYDIFFSDKTEKSWAEPTNFGYPINTHNDEVSMSISSDGTKGYYSHEDKNTSILYEIDIPSKLQVEHKVSYVFGIILDKKTDQPLKAKVSLINLQTHNTIELVESDSINGKYLIVLTEGKDYGLFVEAPRYLHSSENFNLKDKLVNPVQINIKLEPIQLGAKIVLKNIFFKTNKYDLSKTSEVELDKVVALIKTSAIRKIRIVGYTDNVGSNRYNLELSSKRARAVYKYLVNKKISKEKLSFTGLGATNFLYPNKNEKERAQNRRIEFEILK